MRRHPERARKNRVFIDGLRRDISGDRVGSRPSNRPHVLLFHEHLIEVFSADDAGLLDALTQAVSGDRVFAPDVEFDNVVEVPDGITLAGGRYTNLVQINGGTLIDATVDVTLADTGERGAAIEIITDAEGSVARIIDCQIRIYNDVASTAIEQESDYLCEVHRCLIESESEGVTPVGYYVYIDSDYEGNVILYNCAIVDNDVECYWEA